MKLISIFPSQFVGIFAIKKDNNEIVNITKSQRSSMTCPKIVETVNVKKTYKSKYNFIGTYIELKEKKLEK